jgi:hypothetical protein
MGMAMAEPPALLKALADRAVAADVDALKVGATGRANRVVMWI